MTNSMVPFRQPTVDMRRDAERDRRRKRIQRKREAQLKRIERSYR